MIVSGWGHFPKIASNVYEPQNETELQRLINAGDCIPCGNLRSYGDSPLNSKKIIKMKNFNAILEFNSATGQMVLESGVLLSTVLNRCVSDGWFPPVTPGTKYLTIGGMVAADVHGKNHPKAGTIRNYIDWIDLVTAEGKIIRCSPTKNIEMFHWTIGGMGLTGIILRISMRLAPISSGWINQRTIVSNNIYETLENFEHSKCASYAVAWIDCLSRGNSLGRSVLMLGEHIQYEDLSGEKRDKPFYIPKQRELHMPFGAPSLLLTNFVSRSFNALYFKIKKMRKSNVIVDWNTFFYPLDAIKNWNKFYGSRGLSQYQCVLPLENAYQSLPLIIEEIANANVCNFLAVLKRFGEQGQGLSFPMSGYSLAIDFPVNKQTLLLMKRLDAIVEHENGRVYLAKDSRMPKEVFWQMDSRVEMFRNYRGSKNCPKSFNSIQSERLGL